MPVLRQVFCRHDTRVKRIITCAHDLRTLLCSGRISPRAYCEFALPVFLWRRARCELERPTEMALVKKAALGGNFAGIQACREKEELRRFDSTHLPVFWHRHTDIVVEFAAELEARQADFRGKHGSGPGLPRLGVNTSTGDKDAVIRRRR